MGVAGSAVGFGMGIYYSRRNKKGHNDPIDQVLYPFIGLGFGFAGGFCPPIGVYLLYLMYERK